jgi:hypothetical protein
MDATSLITEDVENRELRAYGNTEESDEQRLQTKCVALATPRNRKKRES